MNFPLYYKNYSNSNWNSNLIFSLPVRATITAENSNYNKIMMILNIIRIEKEMTEIVIAMMIVP
jgi:hypothetical protein